MEDHGKRHDKRTRTGENLHLETWRIAGPVILANSSVPLLGAVDTAVMGHMPDPVYLGAIAVGSLIFLFLYTAFNFLRMATTGLTAQSWGAVQRREGGPLELGRVVVRAGLVALLIGAALTALQIPIGWIAFTALGADAEVADLARRYFEIRIWSAPATLLQFAMVGWLLGTRRAGTALGLQVFMNVLNIVLNLLFVIGFGWGVEGVALATLIAEYAAAIIGLLILTYILARDHGLWPRLLMTAPGLLDGGRMTRLMTLNGDLFLRTLLLLSAFAVFTAMGTRMGTLVLAANMVLMNFHHFMSFGLDGFAFAAEAMVGSEKTGSRQMRRVIRVTSLWAGAAAVLYTVVYALAGPFLIGLLTGIGDVRQTAGHYLPWLIAMPVVAVASYQLDGIFVGLTRGRDMRNSMVIAFAAYAAAVAALTPAMANHGLWAAFLVMLVVRALTLGWRLDRILRQST